MVKTHSSNFYRPPTRFVVDKISSQSLYIPATSGKNPTLRPSTGHPQDFAVVKMRHSKLLQASYTHCVGQTNLYRTPIRIAAVKTDSPNHYMATKRFVVTKSDCQELCMLATSFGVAKLNSANLYTHATSFAVVKRDSPSFYRPTKPFCGCQNGLFELLQGADMLCSGKN